MVCEALFRLLLMLIPIHPRFQDAIHVGAAAPHMPQALVDQLAQPGRMFIPVGTYSQAVYQVL